MRLQLGGNVVQAHAQESGSHNVYHDVMGDPCQAGETGPGTSWTGPGFWARQGQGLQAGVLLCLLSVPFRTLALLSSLLLSWPRPHTQCMAFSGAPFRGMATCDPLMGKPSLGMGRLFPGRHRPVPGLHSPGTCVWLRRTPAVLGRLPLFLLMWVLVGGPRRWMRRVWRRAAGVGARGRGLLWEDTTRSPLWDLWAALGPSPGEGFLLGSWTCASACGWLLSLY